VASASWCAWVGQRGAPEWRGAQGAAVPQGEGERRPEEARPGAQRPAQGCASRGPAEGQAPEGAEGPTEVKGSYGSREGATAHPSFTKASSRGARWRTEPIELWATLGPALGAAPVPLSWQPAEGPRGDQAGGSLLLCSKGQGLGQGPSQGVGQGLGQGPSQG